MSVMRFICKIVRQESLGASGTNAEADEHDDDGDDYCVEEGYSTPPRKPQPTDFTPDNMETQAYDMEELLFAG